MGLLVSVPRGKLAAVRFSSPTQYLACSRCLTNINGVNKPRNTHQVYGYGGGYLPVNEAASSISSFWPPVENLEGSGREGAPLEKGDVS